MEKYMKRIYLLMASMCLLFTNAATNAIELETYTAQEGYISALDFVEVEMDFKNAKLVAIGTGLTEIDVLGTTNEIGMDINNGESKGWSYVFVDGETEKKIYVGVGKFFDNYQAQDFTDNIPDFFPADNSTEINVDWIDTGNLVDLISNNPQYQAYIIANPEAVPNLVSLQNNFENPSLKQGHSYWTTTFGENDSFICITDASTGDTECGVVSSVKPYESISNSAFPNPATNSIQLNISDIPNNISLIDMFGNVVFVTNDKTIRNIDLTNMASGSYSIVYEYSNRIETEKIIIKK